MFGKFHWMFLVILQEEGYFGCEQSKDQGTPQLLAIFLGRDVLFDQNIMLLVPDGTSNST